MTEHSLDFFIDTIFNFKKEFKIRMESLGVKSFTPVVGWDDSGEYVISVLIICDKKVEERIKTLLPEEYKNYKVVINYTFLDNN